MESITKEQFLKNTTEEEVFSLIESFLNRVEERGLFKVNEKNLIWTDEEKANIIKEILKDYA